MKSCYMIPASKLSKLIGNYQISSVQIGDRLAG